MRYDQLVSIVARVKPRSIIEVGTHRGARAVLMLAEALKYQKSVLYTGFDVFETESSQFHQQALNGKGVATRIQAERALADLAARTSGLLTWKLHVGDTRKTLHGRRLIADLVFIDGDHRVEVIEGDYAAVAGSGCVVFDDYYRADAEARCPDLQRFGANVIADRIGARVLPAADPIKHGGLVHLAQMGAM